MKKARKSPSYEDLIVLGTLHFEPEGETLRATFSEHPNIFGIGRTKFDAMVELYRIVKWNLGWRK